MVKLLQKDGNPICSKERQISRLTEFFDGDKFELLKANETPAIHNYHSQEHLCIRQHLNELKKRLKPKEFIILDIGCGNGSSIEYFIDIADKIEGIDISKAQEERAKQRFSGNPKVIIKQVNAFDLSKKYPAIFDAVVCLGSTMGNLKDQIGLITQAKSVLRPDGIMLFSVYSEHARDAQIEWYSSIGLAISDRTCDTLNVEDQISKRFTRQELGQLAKQAGMEITIEPLTEIGYLAILRNK